MQKKKITTLFLDIGGVLLSNGWGHNFRRLAAEKFQIDCQEMEERHSIMFVTYEEGKITLNEYLERVVFHQKRDFTTNEFRDYMFSLSSANLEMIAFIKNLKEHYQLKIVAVSNEASELNAHRIDAFKLTEIFDYFISSCYVHLRKPDVAIFQLALDTAQVLADEVVYIDDVQLFVDVATELGINSLRHTDYLSTKNSLALLGLTLV
jgi:putative hydrolase of the HAD superfamily